MIRINLGWQQLICGCSSPILEEPGRDFSFLPINWLLSIREGLAICSANITIWNAPTLPILRVNDEHVMNAVTEYPFSNGEKRDINQCRLYCGIVTLADAGTADGLRLSRSVYNCKERGFRHSRLYWPRVPKPGKSQIATWRRMWNILFLCRNEKKVRKNGTRYRADPRKIDLTLRTPLGKWIRLPTTRQLFDTMYCDDVKYTLMDGKYVSESNTPFDPDSLPSPCAPWEKFDGPGGPLPSTPTTRQLRWSNNTDCFRPRTLRDVNEWWSYFIQQYEFSRSETH